MIALGFSVAQVQYLVNMTFKTRRKMITEFCTCQHFSTGIGLWVGHSQILLESIVSGQTFPFASGSILVSIVASKLMLLLD